MKLFERMSVRDEVVRFYLFANSLEFVANLDLRRQVHVEILQCRLHETIRMNEGVRADRPRILSVATTMRLRSGLKAGPFEHCGISSGILAEKEYTIDAACPSG